MNDEVTPNKAGVLAELEDESRIWACDLEWRKAQIKALRATGEFAVAMPRPPGRPSTITERIAVLPLVGFIGYRPSMLMAWFGGVPLATWMRTLDDLVNAKDVDSILLDVHSPGGATDGVEEAADRVVQARRKKPVAGFSSFAGSAAYWIASAAKPLLALGSSDVGSIGVFVRHIDASEADRQAGFKTTYIASNPRKVELASEIPLSKSAQDYLQAQVDATYWRFVRDVARNRGLSVAGAPAWADGRMYMAPDALRIGLIDGTADSIEDVVLRVSSAERDGRLRQEELLQAAGVTTRRELDAICDQAEREEQRVHEENEQRQQRVRVLELEHQMQGDCGRN